MTNKPAQPRTREGNFNKLVSALQEYWKFLIEDFENAEKDSEDERWLGGELNRVEEFLRGTSEDGMLQLQR